MGRGHQGALECQLKLTGCDANEVAARDPGIEAVSRTGYYNAGQTVSRDTKPEKDLITSIKAKELYRGGESLAGGKRLGN